MTMRDAEDYSIQSAPSWLVRRHYQRTLIAMNKIVPESKKYVQCTTKNSRTVCYCTALFFTFACQLIYLNA